MVTIDRTAWELAERLPHGALYWVMPGIIAAIPDDGVVETPDLSRLVYEGYSRCAAAYGKPIGIVVFVDQLGDQTPEVRRFWAEVMQQDVLCAVALVCKSLFARAVGSFFMGLRKPAVPTRMFATLEEALAWLRQRLQSDVDQ